MANNIERNIPAAEPLLSRILYADDACVVVNKLSGEAVEGAGQGMIDLPKELAAVLPAASTIEKTESLTLPAAAHRLDVPVTGCVIFAWTKSALTLLGAAFANEGRRPPNAAPAVEKRYWAITEATAGGLSIPERGELVHWLCFDTQKNKSVAYNEQGPGRKKAVLRYRLVGRGTNYLFFEIELVTGRHHQIRAQFAKAGLHVKGDLKYGAKRSEKNGGIRLHARSLSFPNPLKSGERITVQADPPLMDNLWEAFKEAANSSGAVAAGN
ncbi:RNA pseudouridine synthase [Spirochaetia bacterium]|nr:RNA pseudouridine synthase [Spirochaetia bacterium]